MSGKKQVDRNPFLPVSKADMEARGWDWYDFLIINGDAYVDHPSFGGVVIARTLEAEGYRVGTVAPAGLAQCGCISCHGETPTGGHALLRQPRLHGSPLHRSKKAPPPGCLFPRSSDWLAAGSGGDRLCQSGAGSLFRTYPSSLVVWKPLCGDLLTMTTGAARCAERSCLTPERICSFTAWGRRHVEIAAQLNAGVPVSDITTVRGTSFAAREREACVYPWVEVPSYEEVKADKMAYARANQVEYEEHDPVRGKAILPEAREPVAGDQPAPDAPVHQGAGSHRRAALCARTAPYVRRHGRCAGH